MDEIRILVVDDHEIIHKGISDLLKDEENYHIIGHAFNGNEAIDMALDLNPDIIFMDIAMPEKNGIEASKEILKQSRKSKIIALSQFEENEYVIQFLNTGGSGYLLKNSRREEFIAAIESVLQGQRYLNYEISQKLLNKVMDTNSPAEIDQQVHLTRREVEIIQSIADDLSNQEIAEKLHISLRTVETHRRNIMQKLGAKSVVSLLKYASAQNIIKI